MKNMKFASRLFISFGILILLLIVIIGLEFVSMSNIESRKDSLLNAEAISDGTQLTRLWTLNYYISGSDEAVSNVEQNYRNTKALIDDGYKLNKDMEVKNTLSTMSEELDKYYDSFVRYKEFADQNDDYSLYMLNSFNTITSELNEIVTDQKIEFLNVIDTDQNFNEYDALEIEDLMMQTEVGYQAAFNSNKSIQEMQSIMISQLQYAMTMDELHDSQVDLQVYNLKAQCDWLYNNSVGQKDKALINSVKSHIDDFTAKYEAYKELIDKQSKAELRLRELEYKIIQAAKSLAETESKAITVNMNKAIFSSLLIGASGVVFGILLALFMSRSLTKKLSLNMMNLSASAGFVSSASKQLAGMSMQLSESSSKQAASVEETSATMEETSAMIKQNADNTVQANVLSDEANASAGEGAGMIRNMRLTMDELKKSSTEISKIIKVIDDIAFQTNMLALNAAVEAARAGDAGLGFAVVAEEVRNLAQRSAKAAKNTVKIIDRNIEFSDLSVAISEEVGEVLEGIQIKTHNVNQIIGDISEASNEQARGVSQVTKAIGEMERVIQSNASTSEETAASAEELKTQANSLESIIDELNTVISGSKRERNKVKFEQGMMIKFYNRNKNSLLSRVK